MAKKRDTRTAITSAVIGALLATLVLFAFFYFSGNKTREAPPTIESGK